MEIIRANRVNKYITDALRIAHSLKEWFNENGVKSIEADLFFDNLIVAVEGNETIGIACYSSYDGIMKPDDRSDIQQLDSGKSNVQ